MSRTVFCFFSAAENLFSLMSRTSVTTAFRAVQLLYCVTETLSFIVQHQTGRTHLSTPACSGMYLETTVLQYCMATTAFLLKTQSVAPVDFSTFDRRGSGLALSCRCTLHALLNFSVCGLCCLVSPTPIPPTAQGPIRPGLILQGNLSFSQQPQT